MRLATVLAIPLLAACGGGGDGGGAGPAEEPNPFGPTGIPPALRGDDAGPTTRGGLPAGLEDNAGVVLDPDEIVFTDPDAEDPDEILPELRELLSAKPQEGPWRDSYTLAFEEAMRVGKPVLIWFTDSRNSPPCKALAEELFNRQEFEEWASETFVRIQLDQRVEGSKLDNEAARKSSYIQDLKQRYKVLGQPTLLVLTPSGEVIGRYKGYRRGQAEYRWGQLRQGAKLANDAHAEWRERMERKGYREWSDPRGRSLFAKLTAYRDGELILTQPDGSRARTREKHLSRADREWIAAEKRKRGIQ